jgi:hypothetical protein
MAKYKNRKVKIDNINFDSAAEGERYCQLKIMQQVGMITDLEVHPVYSLQTSFTRDGRKERGINYEGDFRYVENGHVVVEDVKGMRLPVYKIKRLLFLAKYPQIQFREIAV